MGKKINMEFLSLSAFKSVTLSFSPGSQGLQTANCNILDLHFFNLRVSGNLLL